MVNQFNISQLKQEKMKSQKITLYAQDIMFTVPDGFKVSVNGDEVVVMEDTKQHEATKQITLDEIKKMGGVENWIPKLVAIRDMLIVADYLNKGWVPDWNDMRMDKCCIYIMSSRIVVDVCISNNISICYFKSRENADQAITILGEEKIRLALS